MQAMLDDRAFLLALALYISLIFGGPLWLHRLLGADLLPRFWRKLVRTVGTRLNRIQRSQRDRQIRGMLLTLVMAAACIGLGWSIHHLTRSYPVCFVLEALLLACLLPIRRLAEETRAVAKALRLQRLDLARKAAAPIARRDLATLDDHALCRASVEHLAENFADKIVAPAFWYLAFGLPGALLVSGINLLDHQFGHKDPQHKAFGRWAALSDDVLQFIPSRLSVLFLLAAAPVVPRTRIRGAVMAIIRDSLKFSSPNSGLPVSCMAGALGVTLGGPRRFHGDTINDPWTGNGSAKLELPDLLRGQMLYALACGLVVLLATALNLQGFTLLQR